MKISKTKIGNRTSNFKQSFLNKVIIGVHKNKVYYSSEKTLMVSNDGGKTGTSTGLVLENGSFGLVFTSSSNVILAFANRPSQMFRSTDNGLTWNEISVIEGGFVMPFPNGISSNGNVIIFGEWTLSEFTVSRLFISTDSGLTWSVKKTLNIPLEVRHFHTCQYFGEGVWIATTGDFASGLNYGNTNGSGQVRWYISKDNGTTFVEVENIDQRHRTLSIHMLGGKELIWSADGVPGKQFGAIYKASIDTPHDVELVFHMGKTSWGMAGEGGRFLVPTSLEPGDENNLTQVFSSIDGGKNWSLESYHVAKNDADFVGYRFPFGPDNNGNIYVQTNSLGFVPDGHTTWRATTVFNINN